MLSAEGQMHKRQRRVATPAFSIQNLREMVPMVFKKGTQLKHKWMSMTAEACQSSKESSLTLDVCRWVSRATFDVIGIAGMYFILLDGALNNLRKGFDYSFNAIHDESNALFLAYKEMFEAAVSQGKPWRTMLSIYLPWFNKLFVSHRVAL